MNIDLSIIIVSYNVCDFLRKCLKSIVDSKINHTYEIIIVDNNSTDEILLRKYVGNSLRSIGFKTKKILGLPQQTIKELINQRDNSFCY